jgi:hypothetical protein
MSPTISLATLRRTLISKLSTITTMERGTLYEEYREQPAPDGTGTVRLGPYFKHQCWEDGKNRASRVPAHQVPDLRADLDKAKQFDEITEQLAALATTQSRARRAASPPPGADPDALASKKNSKSNASRNATSKRKPSSRSSATGSRRKA